MIKEILLGDFYHLCKRSVVVLLLFFNCILIAQESFRLPNGLKKDKIKFKLANNLIIIPVTLNGVELSFILDTGVGSTIIFSVEDKKVLELKNASKILLRGLGKDAAVEAIKSVNNEMQIGQTINKNSTLYLVFDDTINFSPQMGFPVHGIIGYDFFKDFILEINYYHGYIKINNPKTYTYKKCKKCYQTNLRFPDGKRPYMGVKHMTKNGQISLNMLIDSGSGSALWLFENEELGIKVPKNSFRDYLGKGFSGDIHGMSSKISSLIIGDFTMKNVTTSFPDSTHVKEIVVKDRQGSIGGGVLKRFNLIMDYYNQKITFKKNGFFKKKFHYNMSGLTLSHSGVRIYQYLNKTDLDKNNNPKFSVEQRGKRYQINTEKIEFNIKSILQPEYIISDVRPDSPADIAGLKEGDAVISINGKNAYLYELSELNDLFYSEEGKKIRMKIDRLGVEIKYVFYLKKVI